MFGSFGQDWRRIMQQAQPMPQTTGSMFPIRGAGGGWMMPGGPAPFTPQPLQQPAPKQENQSPGNGYAFYNGAWHSPESVWGNGGPPGGFMPAFGVGGNTGYGAMGMGVTGQGAFGDLGSFGVGYGDTY